MSDFAAFVPVVNRLDLLNSVILSVPDLYEDFTVIDNSPERLVRYVGPEHRIFRAPVPMTFSQTMNWEMEETARKEKKFCIHMHSDAVIPEGAVQKLLAFVRGLGDRKWAVVYTFYDVLAAYNPEAMKAFGGYDTNLPNYFSDNDWYRRARLAGWECIDSGIEVGHVGSQTINSDPYLKFVNGITFPLYREYYTQKWGGGPGCETYSVPFSRSF